MLSPIVVREVEIWPSLSSISSSALAIVGGKVGGGEILKDDFGHEPSSRHGVIMFYRHYITLSEIAQMRNVSVFSTFELD